MNTFIALIRGINVGGKNILPMRNLVKILEDMRCEEVKTYIQSGNIVFKIEQNQKSQLAREISSRISEIYDFKPHVLLLDISELYAAISNNPFETDNGKALHFFFLDSFPQKPDMERLKAAKANSEEFKLDKTIFYLYTPDGFARSKLAAIVEKSMGVPVTARNWNTVSKIMQMVNNETLPA